MDETDTKLFLQMFERFPILLYFEKDECYFDVDGVAKILNIESTIYTLIKNYDESKKRTFDKYKNKTFITTLGIYTILYFSENRMHLKNIKIPRKLKNRMAIIINDYLSNDAKELYKKYCAQKTHINDYSYFGTTYETFYRNAKRSKY